MVQVERRQHGRTRTWAGVSLLAMLAACALNPATGQRQLALISEAQEVQLGRESAQQVEQTIGLVDDKDLQAYVASIGGRLAAASERPGLPWRFNVVDDPTPNAFALPGGPIFVTRGMMSLMESEAQLASVLGHEIGHVTARHSVTMISRQQLAQLGLGIGGVLVPQLQPLGQALGMGLDLLFLKYGRDAERQADELGFRYANREDYNLEAMADVFASLQRMGELEERSALPSWLSTHPEPAERIEHVRAMLAEQTAAAQGRVGRPEYLKRLDGLVYGQNPRHGFFKEGVFYHPELRFQFAIPPRWQAQNLARAVVAGDPQGPAALQLTLADNVTPEEAARRLAAQQSVRVASSTRQSINGIPAVVTVFDAQTEQAVIRAMAAHLAHGGHTFQLITYSTTQGFAAYQRTFETVIGSFAPVTDRSILEVQPNRVSIVRLDRAMTLDEFSREYPSGVPAGELAILNQVADRTSRLEGGTLAKRIVG
jgi:predicted Zn-dependent protease